MTEPSTITPIALRVLTATWRGLTAVMESYEMTGEGWRTLVEARRLVEVEVREQHGDAAWSRMVDS